MNNEEIKKDISNYIHDVICRKKLTQQEAGEIMGLPQPKVSELVNGKTELFSLFKMLQMLNSLGYDVEINVYPSTEGKGSVTLFIA